MPVGATILKQPSPHSLACIPTVALAVCAALVIAPGSGAQDQGDKGAKGDKGATSTKSHPATRPAPRSSPATLPGYDLSKPKSSYSLPPELEEISALADIDEHTVACVQDEDGTIFFIDLRNGTVTRKLRFGGKGDYEGLARVGKTLWVLRSDGLLTEVLPRDDAVALGRRIRLDIGHADFEGLAYDPFRKALLVAPKDSPRGGKQAKDKRRVFALDPAGGKLLENPVLDTSRKRIIGEAERHGIWLPSKTTKGRRAKVDLKVRFSSVAVHPSTRQLYLLSAADRAVLVFDLGGRLCAAYYFQGREMPKIEAMTFLENGNLVIASEGVDAPARLMVFGK